MKDIPSEEYEFVCFLRILFLIGVLAFAALAIAVPAIQLFKFSVMPHRDLWWHISAADEFSRTQKFGKDPFYEDAPPFTNFGLIDLINGDIARMLDCQARVVCVATFLLGEIIFLLTCRRCISCSTSYSSQTDRVRRTSQRTVHSRQGRISCRRRLAGQKADVLAGIFHRISQLQRFSGVGL